MSADETTATHEQQGTVATADPPDPNSPLVDQESAALVSDLGEDVPDTANLDMLLDVNLKITVELGRAELKFRDVLNLSQGSVVELQRQTS